MREAIKIPSLERLNELLFYDEDDGELYLRVDRGPRKAGMLAGCVNNAGYVSVAIDGKRYLAHRVIWKMKTGTDPAVDIDHEDTDSQNNRFGNLREATAFQNLQNMPLSRRNTSGVKGVYFDAKLNMWRAEIMSNRVKHRLGSFATLDGAREAISAARKKLHGEFARAA